MLIIDSLLKFKFFLSGEVAENLSLFCHGRGENRRLTLACSQFCRKISRLESPRSDSCQLDRALASPSCPLSSALHSLVSNGFDGTEFGSVIGLIRAKHREQSVQEFTHYRYDRLETCFAAIEQTLIESPQMRLAAQGHQGRHVQGTTPMTAAPAADPRPLLHRGAGCELRRVDPREGYPLASIQRIGKYD